MGELIFSTYIAPPLFKFFTPIRGDVTYLNGAITYISSVFIYGIYIPFVTKKMLKADNHKTIKIKYNKAK